MKQFTILAVAVAIAAGQSYIGRLDTIGGTTYDWWASANVHRLLVNSPRYGIHAAWTYSASTSGTSFPDRNTRYNFYDHSIHVWNWTDEYMQSGVNVFGHRTGGGTLAADTSGRAIVGAHDGSGLVLAWDAASGAGIFGYSDGPSSYYWPDIAFDNDSTLHVAMSSGAGVSYSHMSVASGWDSVRVLDSLAFPSYAIAASKTGPSVCATWVGDTSATYMMSDNGGDTWSSRMLLDPPPAFGGDTVTRFSVYGLFPFFDSPGRLHITAAVYPEVHDTAYPNPAEIWHWSPDNQPHWARIHHAGCLPEHMQGSIGYNAIYADRPSMGEGTDGDLYVAWEQFDSVNVETTTSRLRAGVWTNRSTNNGATWGSGLLLTARNTISHRFPCIIDRMIPGEQGDTVCILYLMDEVAGFFVQGEGPATPNPVICQFIPVSYVGISEGHKPQASGSKPEATIVRGVLFLPRDMTELSDNSDRVPRPILLDPAGRKVADLRPGANDVSHLAPGVYFARSESGTRRLPRRFVLVR